MCGTSQGTTAISVPSLESTVLQLKEAIAAKMGHAADSQRLIFTGRVLVVCCLLFVAC